jgi:hypothetical protein
MRSIKTSSLVRRALAVSLGLAFSAPAVYAGNIGDTYSTTTTLTVGIMNNIKNAVNDNDTRITTNTNAITTLNTTVGGHTTSINTLTTDVNNLKNGTPACGTGMVSVGPTCIDTARQGPSVSWLAAVNTCRAANKRLPSPAELVAAHASGAITDLANDTAEHVDALGNSGSGQGMFTGYVGNNLSGLGSPGTGVLQSRTDAAYDTQYPYIYFRCAR